MTSFLILQKVRWEGMFNNEINIHYLDYLIFSELSNINRTFFFFSDYLVMVTTNISEKTRGGADLQNLPSKWRQHTQWLQLKKNKKMFQWPWAYEIWANLKTITQLNHLMNAPTIRLLMPKIHATNTIGF